MCDETDEDKIEENESIEDLLKPEVQQNFADYYQDIRLSEYSEDEEDEDSGNASRFPPDSQPSTFKSKAAFNKVHDVSMNGSMMEGLVQKSPQSKKKV